MKTKKQKSEKTVCFSREKIFEYINEDLKKWLIYKTAAKTFSRLFREGGAQLDDLEQSRGCFGKEARE